MRRKFRETIDKYKMIEKGDHIVVGVSGGVDSMALIDLLVGIQDEYGFNIYVAHVNHGVRGQDAKKDQAFVEDYAKKMDLPFHTIDVDMDGYAKENRITSEEAGRILRYGFFNEILDGVGGGKIAVAHNLNDQAETLIMRFLRGTGIDGLKGIEYRNQNIIRPILGITREELESYIEEENIEIREDMTNFQPIYTRNKIRLEIIPYIEKHFNPNIIRTLERTAALAEIDSSFLEKHSKKRYNSIVQKEDEEEVNLNCKLFKQEDLSIQQRIIRKAILKVNGTLQGISEAQVSQVIDLFISGETGKQVDISNDMIARISYNDLIIKKEEKEIGKYDYILENGSYIEEIGYKIYTRMFELGESEGLARLENARYFDADKIEGQLRVRNRKNGDRFIPFGMKGNKKIKDYFIDEKIPRSDRDRIPLIVDDNEILWVVGYRTSELYRVTGDTERILEIKFERD